MELCNCSTLYWTIVLHGIIAKYRPKQAHFPKKSVLYRPDVFFTNCQHCSWKSLFYSLLRSFWMRTNFKTKEGYKDPHIQSQRYTDRTIKTWCTIKTHLLLDRIIFLRNTFCEIWKFPFRIYVAIPFRFSWMKIPTFSKTPWSGWNRRYYA